MNNKKKFIQSIYLVWHCFGYKLNIAKFYPAPILFSIRHFLFIRIRKLSQVRKVLKAFFLHHHNYFFFEFSTSNLRMRTVTKFFFFLLCMPFFMEKIAIIVINILLSEHWESFESSRRENSTPKTLLLLHYTFGNLALRGA